MGQLHVSVGLYVAFLSGVSGMCGTDRQTDKWMETQGAVRNVAS